MADELYHQAILALAKAGHRSGRLPGAAATATVDNPLCGDRVTVDLTMADGRVAAFAQRVRGCVLCEAAGSALGAHAVGASAAELHAAAAAARAVVAGQTLPDGAWAELGSFAPVHAHKSRHSCVLLPFQALEQALDKAGAA